MSNAILAPVEAPAPTVEAAPSTPEQIPQSETILNEGQKGEVRQLGINVINRKMGDVRAKREKKQALTEGEEKVAQHLLSIEDNLPLSNGEYINKSPLTGSALHVSIPNENGQMERRKIVQVDGRTIVQRDGRDVDMLTCQVEDLNDPLRVETAEVPLSEFIQEQFASEMADLLPAFSSDEQQLLQMHLQDMTEGRITSELSSEVIDMFVAERARNAGVLTKGVMLDFARRTLEQQLKEQNKNDSSEQIAKALEVQMKNINDMFRDGQIPDAPVIMEFLGKFGLNPETLGQQVSSLDTQIADYTRELDKKPHNEEDIRKQIARMESHRDALRTAISILPENGELMQLFEGMQNGTIDAETARGVIESFTSAGDSEQLLRTLLPKLGKEFGWTEDQIRKRIDDLEKRPNLFGLVVAILLSGGKQSIEEMGGVLDVKDQ